MAAEPLFIDSGGFYALVSPDGEFHELAVEILQAAARERRRAVTTDYIIDETATLLRARGLTRLLAEFFRLTEESQALPLRRRSSRSAEFDRFGLRRQAKRDTAFSEGRSCNQTSTPPESAVAASLCRRSP
jgi:predicted nucleic acid-binding protein